jgi:hypothetical protein
MYNIVEQQIINDIYPTKSYFSDLGLFRSLSNENQKTAEFLGELNNDFKNVVDLGCGDGNLVHRIISNSGVEQIDNLLLIDLNYQSLQQANKYLSAKKVAKSISTKCDDIMNNIPECYKGKDIGFLIHVAYFIPQSQFSKIINSIPKNFKLFIVLDKKECVFSQVWEFTAPKYYDRTIYVNDYLNSLKKSEFNVNKKTISSSIKNPFSMDEGIMKKVVSFISYKNVDEMDVQTLEKVKAIFDRYTDKNNDILIETNMFEISR